MSDRLYTPSVVCFLDILGFQGHIDKTVNSDGCEYIDESQRIHKGMEQIRRALDLDSPIEPERPRQVTQFSDSVVISFPYDSQSEVFYTLCDIQMVLIEMIRYGFVFRGGVAHGLVHHSEKYVFGPALNEAYNLENKEAVYPRVIVSESVIEIGSKFSLHAGLGHDEEEYIRGCLVKDDDGHSFVDYFIGTYSVIDEPMYDFPRYMRNLYTIIQTGLEQSTGCIRDKYGWMKKYYNQAADACRDSDFIERITYSEDEDVAEAFKSVKRIK